MSSRLAADHGAADRPIARTRRPLRRRRRPSRPRPAGGCRSGRRQRRPCPSFVPLGDQRLSALLPLDQVEHRVVGVGLGLVAEVDARVEADVDAASNDPGIDVRRHDAAVPALDGARLDGLEGVDAAREIGRGAAPAAKVRVEPLASAGDRPDGRTCRRRWPARSRSARLSARCRCRRRPGLRCGCARLWSACRRRTLPKLFAKMSKPAACGARPMWT